MAFEKALELLCQVQCHWLRWPKWGPDRKEKFSYRRGKVEYYFYTTLGYDRFLPKKYVFCEKTLAVVSRQ